MVVALATITVFITTSFAPPWAYEEEPSVCPVCEMLRVERAALERAILRLGWDINDAKDVLREEYQRRSNERLRIIEIGTEISRLERNLALICLLDPTGIVCYIAMIRIGDQIHQLRLEKQELENYRLPNTEYVIELWEAVIERYEEAIRQHRARIEEIDREIASCRYPPEH